MALCLILKTLLIFAVTNVVFCTEVAVQTPVGTIYGVSNVKTRRGHQYTFSSFLEIPYAEPPTGIRRFEKPERKAFFKTPFYANNSENIACLSPRKYPSYSDFKFQEDCLLLNVFVPGDMVANNSLPVMVYIHGGSFLFGSQSSFKAPLFAAKSGAILVTINYRLNVFGFLSNEKAGLKGNYGLWDQHMAIKWVHDNIKAFGGDPNRVTLFGNSAGSGSVIYQALYPGNKNLFQGIIAESGSPMEHWDYLKNPAKDFQAFQENLGCKGDPADIVKCIRESPVDLLNSYNVPFTPTVDHEFLTSYPDELFENYEDELNQQVFQMFGSINVIIGMNTNDGCFAIKNVLRIDNFSRHSFTSHTDILLRFRNRPSNQVVLEKVANEYIGHLNVFEGNMIKQGYLDVEMELAFTLQITLIAKVHSSLNGKGNTYFYVFDHRPSFSNLPSWAKGANHADELPFVFWFPDSIMHDFFDVNSTDPSEYLTPEEFELADAIIDFWVQFAKTGDPNTQPSTKHWPTYDADTQKYLKFQANVDPFPIGSSFRSDKIKFWLEKIPEIYKSSTATTLMLQYSWLLIVFVFHKL